jgi:hypothetical protein
MPFPLLPQIHRATERMWLLRGCGTTNNAHIDPRNMKTNWQQNGSRKVTTKGKIDSQVGSNFHVCCSLQQGGLPHHAAATHASWPTPRCTNGCCHWHSKLLRPLLALVHSMVLHHAAPHTLIPVLISTLPLQSMTIALSVPHTYIHCPYAS